MLFGAILTAIDDWFRMAAYASGNSTRQYGASRVERTFGWEAYGTKRSGPIDHVYAIREVVGFAKV